MFCWREDLADVVDWALDFMDFAFFHALDDECGTDHLVGGGYV